MHGQFLKHFLGNRFLKVINDIAESDEGIL